MCHGAGHLHVDGAGMSYAIDSAVYYEIHGEYDFPVDHCSGVGCHGAFVHKMFQDDYVVHVDTVVLGSVVQAVYVVQPACVVHGDNMICDDAVQSDYVAHGDNVVRDGAFQFDYVVLVDVVLDDETAVQVGSVNDGDNVVQYDIQGC